MQCCRGATVRNGKCPCLSCPLYTFFWHCLYVLVHRFTTTSSLSVQLPQTCTVLGLRGLDRLEWRLRFTLAFALGFASGVELDVDYRPTSGGGTNFNSLGVAVRGFWLPCRCSAHGAASNFTRSPERKDNDLDSCRVDRHLQTCQPCKGCGLGEHVGRRGRCTANFGAHRS